jgi:hypothetical protein
LVFLISFLGCAAYYLAWQLHHWPEFPGFVILVGGLPWSWLWLAVEHHLVNLNTVNMMDRPDLYVVSLGVLAAGFSFNCMLVYLGAALIRSKLRRHGRTSTQPKPWVDTHSPPL